MRGRILALLYLSTVLGASLALGQQTDIVAPVPARLVGTIDNTSLVTLRGNVRKDLTADRDMGVVEDGMPIRLYLILKRSADQQARLDNLIARQQQPGAAEYHKWLTPKEFGQHFGLAPEDIAKITNWLESQGFQVKSVLNNASMIDFQATAGGVRNTFHTQLHYWNVEGGKYLANANEPRIPAALASTVSGVAGLNKIPVKSHHTPFKPTSYDTETHRWHTNAEASANGSAQPKYSDGNGNYLLAPGDFYTIYNVNPIYKTGNLGAGATISLPEPTDMKYGTVNGSTGAATGGDVATFRKVFGVAGTLNMTVMHGAGTVTCGDPGITDAEGEATLDAEWSNAVAPSAHLIFMSCDDSNSIGDGFTTALTALIDNNISDVISSSYGNSEYVLTSSQFAQDDALTSQAAAQGQSFLDAAGDAGAADADQNTTTTAVDGYNVDQFAGTPLVTAVGGTDFSDKYDADLGGPPQSTYWGANSAFYADALGYIPETPWNSSCADSIIALDLGSTTPANYCAEGPSSNPNVDGAVVGGGGGFSVHYAQPAYQPGTPGLSASATKRATPDIAFFAANGFWGHYLLVCDSNSASSACTSPSTFGGAGGTSFTAPQFAGVTALLVTYTGERQGTLNPALYALGKAQFTNSATKTACYSNGQTSNTGVTKGLPASSCIFHDITTGNNDEPCEVGSLDCYVNSGAQYGLLSLKSPNSLTIAYPSGVGYDETTGLGSVNIANLITKWNTAFTSSTSLTANPTSITAAQSTSLTATVTGAAPTGYTGTAPTLTGSVNFAAGSTAVGSCTLSTGTCSTSVAGSVLASGANSITATFVGSNTYPSSTSSVVTVTVTGSTTTATPTFTPGAGTYTTAQSVKIADTTTGAVIYYTANGKTPTTSSTKYTGPITVATSETLEAIAVASGVQSATAIAQYTISQTTVPPPVFSPGSTTFTVSYPVKITDAANGAVIYYTTNKTKPTTSSTKYTGPITVSSNETIEAIAVVSGTESPVAEATYIITKTVPTPTFSPKAGTYSKAQKVTIKDFTRGARIYYAIHKSNQSDWWKKYTGPIEVSESETIEARAEAWGYKNSPVAKAKYTIKK